MKTEKITIRITEELKKKLEAEAFNRDIPVAQLARELIKGGLNKCQQQ